MPRQWIISSRWDGCDATAERLRVSPLLTQLLHNRGVSEPQSALSFLKPELKALHAPECLPGVVAAAEIIAGKVREGRRIVIYGDYDVDGITATAILWHLLKIAGADVSYYIPHRLEEGYGVNADAIRQIAAEGADTIVTVDCGITAVEETQLAHERGLTLIVTDHHAPGPQLPQADVVVHPCLGEGYPNRDLCGAGVAFKLAWAIAQHLSRAKQVAPEFRDFLVNATGLVALGTIADVVPLVGENRILVRHGLTGLAESKLTGLKALIASARLETSKIDSDHVGFWLAPRLNAAGRMGHARLAVELLTDAGEDRAAEIAHYLEEQNRGRKAVEKEIYEKACERVEAGHLASDARRAIVLAEEGWHAGVIGIVAARLVDRYHRPVVMIAIENGQGQGSARSIRHFELHRALEACAEHLIGFGGHAMAAGLRIERARIDVFTEAFVELANRQLTGKDLEPALHLDAEVRLGTLTQPLVRDLSRLGPFGEGNPRPRFASSWLELVGEPRIVGQGGRHLQFSVTDGRSRLKAIAFQQARHRQAMLNHRRCRVAFEPILNTFNGTTSVELQVIDIAFPEA